MSNITIIMHYSSTKKPGLKVSIHY